MTTEILVLLVGVALIVIGFWHWGVHMVNEETRWFEREFRPSVPPAKGADKWRIPSDCNSCGRSDCDGCGNR